MLSMTSVQLQIVFFSNAFWYITPLENPWRWLSLYFTQKSCRQSSPPFPKIIFFILEVLRSGERNGLKITNRLHTQFSCSVYLLNWSVVRSDLFGSGNKSTDCRARYESMRDGTPWSFVERLVHHVIMPPKVRLCSFRCQKSCRKNTPCLVWWNKQILRTK